MSNQFEALNQTEIISVGNYARILLSHPTFKVNELTAEIIEMVKSKDRLGTHEKMQIKWFNEGVKCEVLKVDGKGWQKGKVRLAIEFCPEEPENEQVSSTNGVVEPESPLDDLRQMVN